MYEIYLSDGTKIASYTYDAWGNFVTNYSVTDTTLRQLADEAPFRYRGYYFDRETGFYYLNTRYYDPAICRFINADDISYLGANGDLQAYNLYAYCSNNPVMYVDPTGKAWYDALINIVDTLWASIEAFAGVGFGIGGEIAETVEFNAYRDTGLTLDDGRFGAANSVVGSMEIKNTGVSVSAKALTHEGHYGNDNIIEQYCAELSCKKCKVEDAEYFSVVKIKKNNDFVLETSGSIHFIAGGSYKIGFNFSEFFRRLIDDWNR